MEHIMSKEDNEFMTHKMQQMTEKQRESFFNCLLAASGLEEYIKKDNTSNYHRRGF